MRGNELIFSKIANHKVLMDWLQNFINHFIFTWNDKCFFQLPLLIKIILNSETQEMRGDFHSLISVKVKYCTDLKGVRKSHLLSQIWHFSNGWYPQILLSWGIRQGCPASQYLFLLGAQLLARMLQWVDLLVKPQKGFFELPLHICYILIMQKCMLLFMC